MTVSRWFIPRIGVVDSKGTSVVTGHRYDQVIFKVSIINNHTREDPTHGHHQMFNNEIRLIILLRLTVAFPLPLATEHVFPSFLPVF